MLELRSFYVRSSDISSVQLVFTYKLQHVSGKKVKKNIFFSCVFSTERTKMYNAHTHSHVQRSSEHKKLNQQNGNEKTITLRVCVFFYALVASLFLKQMWMYDKLSIWTWQNKRKNKHTFTSTVRGLFANSHTLTYTARHSLCINYVNREDGKMAKIALCWRWSD